MQRSICSRERESFLRCSFVCFGGKIVVEDHQQRASIKREQVCEKLTTMKRIPWQLPQAATFKRIIHQYLIELWMSKRCWISELPSIDDALVDSIRKLASVRWTCRVTSRSFCFKRDVTWDVYENKSCRLWRGEQRNIDISSNERT